MKRKSSVQKGYVLAMTVAVTTVVTILLGVIFTSVITLTRSTSGLNQSVNVKRKIKNDAYKAYEVIWKYTFYSSDTSESVEEELNTIEYEICTYVPDSYKTENNNFQLKYENLTATVSLTEEPNDSRFLVISGITIRR